MFDRSCAFRIPSPNLPLPSPHPAMLTAMAPEHPSSTRQPDNRSAIRPCRSGIGYISWRNLALWSMFGLTPFQWGAHHGISPSILLRPWQRRENPKQNSSAFVGPTPAPTLIPQWSQVTRCFISPCHYGRHEAATHIHVEAKEVEAHLCAEHVCGHRCSFNNPPLLFKRPKVSAEITKDQPSMHSVNPSVYDPSISLRSTDQNRTAFLIQCCHCSCCICLHHRPACRFGLHAQPRSFQHLPITKDAIWEARGRAYRDDAESGSMVRSNIFGSADAGKHFHLAATDRLLMKQLPP